MKTAIAKRSLPQKNIAVLDAKLPLSTIPNFCQNNQAFKAHGPVQLSSKAMNQMIFNLIVHTFQICKITIFGGVKQR